jgi:hypothetical protein
VVLDETAEEGARHVFNVIETTSDLDQILKGDSVWISDSGNIADEELNMQANPRNRRVELAIKVPPVNLISLAINSPFGGETGGSAAETGQIQNTIKWVKEVYERAGISRPEESGPVIIARPDNGRTPRWLRLSGTVSVYDVVKNMLADREPMAFDPDKKALVYMWNGRNRNGKRVASGTYVALMSVESEDGTIKTVLPVRIGIKH